MNRRKHSIGSTHAMMFGPLTVSLRSNFIRIDDGWAFNDEKFLPDGQGNSISVSGYQGGTFSLWGAEIMAAILNQAVANGEVTDPYDAPVWGWGTSSSGFEYIYVVSGHVPNFVQLAGSGVEAPIDTGTIS